MSDGHKADCGGDHEGECVTIAGKLAELLVLGEHFGAGDAVSLMLTILTGGRPVDPGTLTDDEYEEGASRLAAIIRSAHFALDMAHITLGKASTLRQVGLTLDQASRVASGEGTATVLDEGMLDALGSRAGADLDDEIARLLGGQE